MKHYQLSPGGSHGIESVDINGDHRVSGFLTARVPLELLALEGRNKIDLSLAHFSLKKMQRSRVHSALAVERKDL